MKRANMNMVRVWGGGYYESDDFYELCDKYGILVWQDVCFACSGYPFALDDFKENVFREIRDNVVRLRHHASLALWCGNNEIESMSAAWFYRRKIIRDTGEFFYQILPNWVRKFDDVTEYWGCSPSSGEYMKNINSDDFGDTHLWNVWHGMRSVQFYRKRYTRFCSEFGLQSYPSMNCLREVIPEDQRYLKSTALDAHQKCGDGDTKMLYYVNKRFWEPKQFGDLVYLTQLAQLECIRDATEHWRRNRGRCNGALYWQLNDCWPGTSWSGMDYYGNYLALMYGARKFNEPVAVSLENNWRQIKVFGLNDTCTAVPCRCVWRLELFDGTVVEQGEFDCTLEALASKRLAEFDFKNKIEKSKESQGVFVIRFYSRQGDVLSERRAFLYRENACPFPDAGLETEIAAGSGKAVITVRARQYARFIALDMEGCHQPFSDNYFDLSAGESTVVEIEIPPDWSREEAQRRLRVHSLADVEPKMSSSRRKLKQLSIMVKPVNVVNWISRFFDK